MDGSAAPTLSFALFERTICPPCAAVNWEKRHQTADLSGRVAIVTGGRVKIGYQAGILLLRLFEFESRRTASLETM